MPIRFGNLRPGSTRLIDALRRGSAGHGSAVRVVALAAERDDQQANNPDQPEER
jgi:hypothetical protein